jgi:hypothetical protein
VNEPWRTIFARAELALLVLVYGASAAFFFVALALGVGWLTAKGYGALGQLVVFLYLMSSLPILIAQAGVLVDVLLRFIGETVVVLPALRAIADKTPPRRMTRAVASLLTTVSPLSSISAWALSSLTPFDRVTDLIRAKHRAEASILQATVSGFRKRV